MGFGKRVVLSSAAGYGATAAMDRVTTKFLERQSEISRQRERQVQPEPATTVLVKKIAKAMDQQITEEQAQRLGQLAHVGLGVGGAYLAGAFLSRGWRAIPAGMATGMLIWLLFDEGMNYVLGLAAPATEFPRETHLRGLAGHLAYGGALGALLAVARWLWRD